MKTRILLFCVLALIRPLPRVAAAESSGSKTHPLSFNLWHDRPKHSLNLQTEKRTEDADEESFRVDFLMKYDDLDIRISYENPQDWSEYEALTVVVYSPRDTEIRIRMDDSKSKGWTTQFDMKSVLKRGLNRILIPIEAVGEKIDVKDIVKIVIYPDPKKVDADLTLWFDAIFLGPADVNASMSRVTWAAENGGTRPNPFAKPDPEIVLRHTYDEEPGIEDVLDFSNHGNIGEFNDSDKIIVGGDSGDDLALRLYGEYRKGRSFGYRVMPSDSLVLEKGAVTFWMVADPSCNARRQVILCGPGRDRKKQIALVKSRRGTFIEVSFGKRLTGGPLPAGKWVHVAWVFDSSSQQLFLDGKKVVETAGGAKIDGSRGLFVGHDGSRWEKDHAGGNGFAGTLDDLRIFKVKPKHFPGLESPPDRSRPPLGLVFSCDFNTDQPENRAGTALKATDGEITEKGVPGWNSWKKGDKAWVFREDKEKGGSFLELPPHPLLNLPDGTLDMRFRIDEYHHNPQWAFWYVWNVYREPLNNGYGEPYWILHMVCLPRKGAEYTQKSARGMEMTVDYHDNRQYTPALKLEYLFKTGEWIHLVVAWHTEESLAASFAYIWLDGKYLGRFEKSTYRFFGKGPLRLGTIPLRAGSSPGANMTVTDLKIYNYCRSVLLKGD